MSDILVVEKVVAPHASWVTIGDEFSKIITNGKSVLKIPPDSENDWIYEPIHAVKVIFDRKYPYFWLDKDLKGFPVGVAFTMSDVERAAMFDEDTGELTRFNIYADGVMALDGPFARCIAMGPRQHFYILPGMVANSYKTESNGEDRGARVFVSAQNEAVCPVACTTGR